MKDFGLLATRRASAPSAPPVAPKPVPPVEVVSAPPVQVTSQVTVSAATIESKAYLCKQPEHWTWEDLRDYVMGELISRFGPQVREPLKERGVFSSFLKRYGNLNAVTIAMAAFDVYEGMWHSAPIGRDRFCRNSDAYFGDVILKSLEG